MTYSSPNGYNFRKTGNSEQSPRVDTYGSPNALNFKKDGSQSKRKNRATGGAVTTPVAPTLTGMSQRTSSNMPT